MHFAKESRLSAHDRMTDVPGDIKSYQPQPGPGEDCNAWAEAVAKALKCLGHGKAGDARGGGTIYNMARKWCLAVKKKKGL